MAASVQPLERLPGGLDAARQESYIEAAARRCREVHRLDPSALPRSENVGAAALGLCREAVAELWAVARPELHRLFRQLAPARYVLLLTDAAGTVLEICADAADRELVAAAKMAPGFIWDEAHEGTNGPGTSLHDRRPRVVHRSDHFFHANRHMTCSSAPIWGANGRLLGALDASRLDSSDSRASQSPTIALVGLTARIIEQLHFANEHRDCLLVRLHDRPLAVSQPQDELLAIGEDGRIRAADSAALMRLAAGDPAALIGKSAAELLELPLERLFERAASPGPAWPFVAGDGRRRYASFVNLGDRVRRPGPAGRRSETVRRADRSGRQRLPLKAPPACDERVAENVRRANLVMDRDIPILLQGETGTGKDTFARAIHRASERFDRPFVAVNCVAIPETLVESELFGYEPGAFTGARPQGMRGKVLAADGGTLFLDEIGDMPLAVQARLLRLLEEKEIVPLGASKPLRVDLKVISATHRDLRDLVARGDFRIDLYYRLNGVTLTLPALRERSDRRALIDDICREEARAPPQIEPAALAALLAHGWPGNLRELRHTLRTAFALAGGGPVGLAHLPCEVRSLSAGSDREPVASRGGTAQDAERARIHAELERQHWRIGKTAAVLGVSRNTLYRKLHRYGLMPS
jgi:sigma-54 dependent transcriptional regulator, acetoin dehydrogenase operon transcriptional activator AcoR